MKFTLNQNKAMQTLLWILNKRPDISAYNINKVMFSADCYSLNHFGRLIYGDRYVAMKHGTVPSFMYGLTKITENMPFYKSSDFGFSTDCKANNDVFSEGDIESLEYGINEYADLSFDEVEKKNHQHRAWKNCIEELKKSKSADIPYEDMIDNEEVLKDLQNLGSLTENMGF